MCHTMDRNEQIFEDQYMQNRMLLNYHIFPSRQVQLHCIHLDSLDSKEDHPVLVNVPDMYAMVDQPHDHTNDANSMVHKYEKLLVILASPMAMLQYLQ